MFQDYIDCLMERQGGEIQSFTFRDKTKGWGSTAKCVYNDKYGKTRTLLIPFQVSSYYQLFINGDTCRPNCYTCPFACRDRIGDITLGDFWGIQKQHPQWMQDNGGIFSDELGVSCILVNTDKGKKFVETMEAIELRQTEIEKIAEENKQLSMPSPMPDSREKIMSLYEESNYSIVEKYFHKNLGIKKHYYYLRNRIPKSIKKRIKRILQKL